MRIGIVGGASKNQARYQEVARVNRCEVEFHDGYTTSRATQALEGLVARCDVVVIVTRVNSHRAAQLARKLTRQRDRGLLIVRRFGLRHLKELAYAQRTRAVAAAA